uniref:Pathogenesis-related protein 1 n=1 Tax=Moniliophthora perniciosa TaxID=153609 RepID=A0A8E7D6L2_MONPR|nr:pathogenesis-related protein 1 [Moniliophthora perniciosa]QVT77504.1 pathogenesis-related protein 1 [Moniliophthora perniciosa]QVT77505.1 pathogenesis-related protein 1 [Moniliophthora perniciosa]QVT77511.1 pathogenesis-related protein 1 [Moniliophthora perniciosa]QVT77516.1 pathogenesis-related protein 1 [Moniliophthora perniciosa]
MKLNSFYTLLSFTFVSLQAFAAPHDPRDNDNSGTWLELHNKERGQYGAGELTWDGSLAQKAEESAKQCQLEASAGQNTGYAESPDKVFKLWAETGYNYPGHVSEATPWIQIVYKSTRSVGCASASCDSKVLNVCSYDIPIDKDYANQVEGGGKKKSPSKNIAIPPLAKGGKKEKEEEKEGPKHKEKGEEKEGPKHKEKEKEGPKHKEEEKAGGGEENDNLKHAEDVISRLKGKITSDPTGATDTWNKRDIGQM